MKPVFFIATVSLAALALNACSPESKKMEGTNHALDETKKEVSDNNVKPKTTPIDQGAASVPSSNQALVTLDSILEKQPKDVKERYFWRHPKETLQFFGLKPGMTVVETFPGGGWYSKIIGEYIGSNGTLIGVNYNDSMWPKFGLPEEWVAERLTGLKKWSADLPTWIPNNTPKSESYTFESLPESLNNSVDIVLFIRSLHNLSRFNEDGYLDEALKKSFSVLKPGGVLGIVQHETTSEIAVDGSRGYMNEAKVIEVIAKLGFQLVAETKINHNPKDTPEDNEIVWRLPPGLHTSENDPEARKKYQAIGESNRMTLKFIKPNA